MCGICGWATRVEASPPNGSLEAMADSIAHRGPDGFGYHQLRTLDGTHDIALGHRRLAIIDPAGGYQPMFDEHDRFPITFNGEIYNFRELREDLKRAGFQFRTSSDTEVLISAYKHWGSECVYRLRGMFAFAIWDSNKEELFIARDRFGKKPLFLYQTNGSLFFASEIKALLALPQIRPKLDLGSVADYLLYRYVPGPNTFFKGVTKLAPGSYAVWKRGQLIEESYYVPPDAHLHPVEDQPKDPIALFGSKLDESVRIRMVSDVPFGVFLSGGLDSSTVAALMCRHLDTRVKSFSVGFTDDRYSESPFGRIVAKHLNTDHEEVFVDECEVRDQLPNLIRLSDAPVSEPGSVMVHLLSLAASKSVKMVLTGEGADELLGGYPKHLAEPYAGIYQKLVPNLVHRSAIEPLVNSLPFSFRRLKTLIANIGICDARERMPRWFGALTREEITQLTKGLNFERRFDERPFCVSANQSALRKICYFDQTSVLPDDLLERGDRMTMGASIEARMPFIDHELAETVASLDDNVRIRGSDQKWILRQFAKTLLPLQIAERPKLGFSTPLRSWFRDEMSDFISDCLTGPDSMSQRFFDRKDLTAIVQDHISGRSDNEKLIWMLLNLELFQRAYRLS
jgi:asparagine synthase (glutamine-hydrolysing)